jgi:hypothetical protein
MWALLAVGCFLLAVLVHLATVRAPLPFSNVVRYLIVGTGAGLMLGIVGSVVFGLSGELFAALSIFAFLSELYLFFITLVISSVSVSLLVYLRAGALDDAAIEQTFAPSRMVSFRLDQLVRNGFATRQDGQYGLTPAGRRLVWWFGLLRELMGHEQVAGRARRT